MIITNKSKYTRVKSVLPVNLNKNLFFSLVDYENWNVFKGDQVLKNDPLLKDN